MGEDEGQGEGAGNSGAAAGQIGQRDGAEKRQCSGVGPVWKRGGSIEMGQGCGVTAEPEQIARGLSLAELAEATNMWWVTYAKDIENTQIDTLVRAKSASKAEVEAAAGRWAGRAPVSGRQPCLGNGAFRPHTAAKPGQGGQAGAV